LSVADCALAWAREPTPGVIALAQSMLARVAIEDLVIVVGWSAADAGRPNGPERTKREGGDSLAG